MHHLHNLKQFLMPFRLKFLGKLFFKIFIYFSFPSSNLFTLPNNFGFVNCFVFFASISFSIFFLFYQKVSFHLDQIILNHYHKRIMRSCYHYTHICFHRFSQHCKPFVGKGPRVKTCIPPETNPETSAGSKV